ncbi:MAG: hypothetical protein ACHQ4H_06245 [Ktedonobacterales bacterium]
MATFARGGYLDDALPAYHVFIDSRSDVYNEGFLHDYSGVNGVTPGWQAILTLARRWALPHVAEPLAQMLAVAPYRHAGAGHEGGVATPCVRMI